MNTYVILLRRMDRYAGRTQLTPLQPSALSDLAEGCGVKLIEIATFHGVFDAMLLCRAPDNSTLARLLTALEGWHTEALLATSHARFEQE